MADFWLIQMAANFRSGMHNLYKSFILNKDAFKMLLNILRCDNNLLVVIYLGWYNARIL